MRNIEKAQSTSRKHEIRFDTMLNSMGNSLSAHASCDNKKDKEDKANNDENIALGKLSEDDEPG